VVNLVGEAIAGGRWTDARRKLLRDSRIVSTRALVGELRALPAAAQPRVLVAASAVGYYGDRGDEILTEASASGTGFLAELARDWEGRVDARRRAGDARRGAAQRRRAVTRGRLPAQVLPVFRLGAGGRVGNGAQWFPWIHIQDEIALHPARHLDRERVRRRQRRRPRAASPTES